MHQVKLNKNEWDVLPGQLANIKCKILMFKLNISSQFMFILFQGMKVF